MRGSLFAFGLILLSLASPLRAGDVKSGLPIGARVPPYEIVDPERVERGEAPRYLMDFGDAPAVVLFARPGAPQTLELVQFVDRLLARHQGLKGLVVIQGGPEVVPEVAALMVARKLTVPLFYLPTGKPPKPFKIHAEAQNTVMVYRAGTVRANFVNLRPAEFDRLAAAVAEVAP